MVFSTTSGSTGVVYSPKLPCRMCCQFLLWASDFLHSKTITQAEPHNSIDHSIDWCLHSTGWLFFQLHPMPTHHGCYYGMLPFLVEHPFHVEQHHTHSSTASCLCKMSPLQLIGGTAHTFCLIEQSQRKNWNFGGVTHQGQCGVALIDAIITLVYVFITPPFHACHGQEHCCTFFFLLHCSSMQATSTWCHCNLLTMLHIVFAWANV